MTLNAAITALALVDRAAAHWIATLFALVPPWAAASSVAATGGPLAALLVWAVGALRLGPAQDGARAARLLGLASAAFVGVAWAVAWAVGMTGRGVAPIAGQVLTPADSAAAPLGGAVLTLGLASAVRGARAPLLLLVAWLCVIGRLGVGADGPLQAVAEVLSAVLATGLVRQMDDLRQTAHAAAARLATALGLTWVPTDA